MPLKNMSSENQIVRLQYVPFRVFLRTSLVFGGNNFAEVALVILACHMHCNGHRLEKKWLRKWRMIKRYFLDFQMIQTTYNLITDLSMIFEVVFHIFDPINLRITWD